MASECLKFVYFFRSLARFFFFFFLSYKQLHLFCQLQPIFIIFKLFLNIIVHDSKNIFIWKITFSTCDSGPLVSDASGRWRLNSLFQFVWIPSKPVVVLPLRPPPPGTRILLLPLYTALARYILWPTYGWKPKLNPTIFLEFFFFFFFCTVSRTLGVSCSGIIGKFSRYIEQDWNSAQLYRTAPYVLFPCLKDGTRSPEL